MKSSSSRERCACSEGAREQMRQTIDRQSAQLTRIVDDLLDISRITRGVLELDRRPENLVAIVAGAIETASASIGSRGHQLEVVAPPLPLMIEADTHRLNQVLANLLNNAARYTPEGGTIAVTVGVEGGRAVVRVRDNGRGIEPEMHERIFDMFVQGRSPLQRVSGGLGVGLALARRLAEMHEGTLEVRSEGVGKGAEFTLSLPLPRSANVHAATQLQSGSLPEAGAPVIPRRVLVVDDNTDAARSLELLLKSLGHQVQVAHDGIQALESATQFRPDLVLLDIGMPGLNGYEVARRLRALRPSDSLRIVAITGWGQEVDRQLSRDAGFDLHLVKPVDMTVLERVLSGRNDATVH